MPRLKTILIYRLKTFQIYSSGAIRIILYVAFGIRNLVNKKINARDAMYRDAGGGRGAIKNLCCAIKFSHYLRKHANGFYIVCKPS